MSTLSEIYRSIRSDQSNDQSSEGGMDMDGRKKGRKGECAYGAHVTGHCSADRETDRQSGRTLNTQLTPPLHIVWADGRRRAEGCVKSALRVSQGLPQRRKREREVGCHTPLAEKKWSREESPGLQLFQFIKNSHREPRVQMIFCHLRDTSYAGMAIPKVGD